MPKSLAGKSIKIAAALLAGSLALTGCSSITDNLSQLKDALPTPVVKPSAPTPVAAPTAVTTAPRPTRDVTGKARSIIGAAKAGEQASDTELPAVESTPAPPPTPIPTVTVTATPAPVPTPVPTVTVTATATPAPAPAPVGTVSSGLPRAGKNCTWIAARNHGGGVNLYVGIGEGHGTQVNHSGVLTVIQGGAALDFESCSATGWVRANYNGSLGWVYNTADIW